MTLYRLDVTKTVDIISYKRSGFIYKEMNPLPTRLTARSLNPENMMVLYIRVSTNEQKLYGSSYEAQEKILRAYAKSKGKTYKLYGDTCSGATKPEDRPGMSAAMKFLMDGKATSIAVTRIDRLSRSMRDFVNLVGDFEDQGITSHYLDTSLDTSTTMGKFMVNVFASLAEMERDIIKERTKNTLNSMREDNRVVGTVPYGMKAVEVDGRRVQVDNPEELYIIKRVRELRAMEVVNKRGKTAPMTYQAICDVLIAEGVKNREGSTKWYPSSIRHLLPKKAKAGATIEED